MTTANIAKMLPGPLCLEAREWLLRQPDARTAWETCRRGDWMLYQLGHARGVDRRQLVLAACECARLALRYVLAGEHRPRIAIETAEAWCRGEATTEQLRQAREAANCVGTAVAALAATAAVDAAYADAAYADAAAAAYAYATAADYAAASAAAAAYASASAAAAAANLDDADASRLRSLEAMADIVRKHFTLDDMGRPGGEVPTITTRQVV